MNSATNCEKLNSDEENTPISMAEEAKTPAKNKAMEYINPLSLEAHMFLGALQTLGLYTNEIDEVLCKTLIQITHEIDKLTQKNLKTVRQSETVQIMTPDKFTCIKCVYECEICNDTVGNLKAACKHLINGHVRPKRTRRNNRKLSESQEQTTKEKVNYKMKIPQLPTKVTSLLNSDFKKLLTDSIQTADKLKCAPEHIVIACDLSNIIKELYPNNNVEVFTFGSRTVGIANHGSDLDIFADIGNTFQTFKNRGSQDTLDKLRNVRMGIKKSRDVWKNFTSIEKARVPIIKVTHIATGIDCDINFSNSLGFCNSKLMEYLLRLQPIARHLCIFMKRWMDRSKIKHISSYTFTLLTVFYLQVRQELPPISQIVDDNTKIGPWRSSFVIKSLSDFDMKQQEPTISNWMTIQREFFIFFANFNYNKFIICTYLGRMIPKSDFERQMPESYCEWVKNNPKLCMTSLVVQDPLELNHNVAKNINPCKLKTLIAYFDLSAKVLAKHKNSY